ncbi:MAG: type IV pilus assembly protein PilM [Candidatus Paceibacterota bacterium]|jgi:type IV pilus assembly protein PilM
MANFFSDLFKNISGGNKIALFKQENSSVVGIDIGGSSIKAVQLRKEHGKALLETYGEIALGPYAGLEIGQATNLPTSKIIEALKDLFREANITTNRAAFAIPLKSSMITLIEIPVQSEGILDQVVPIEARKYIPVPISEVALDWWAIPPREIDEPGVLSEKPKEAKSVEVLLAAIHNTTISQYQEIMKGASLESKIFEVETFSAVRSAFVQSPAPQVILDFGAGSTKVYIIDMGIVRVSQLINKGSQDITLAISKSLNLSFVKAEELKRKVGILGRDTENISPVVNPILEYIFYEVNRIISGFHKKYGRVVSNMFLIGNGASLKGLVELAASQFDNSLVPANPFAKVQAPAFLDPMLAAAGPSFAVAVGVALKELQ